MAAHLYLRRTQADEAQQRVHKLFNPFGERDRAAGNRKEQAYWRWQRAVRLHAESTRKTEYHP